MSFVFNHPATVEIYVELMMDTIYTDTSVGIYIFQNIYIYLSIYPSIHLYIC